MLLFFYKYRFVASILYTSYHLKGEFRLHLKFAFLFNSIRLYVRLHVTDTNRFYFVLVFSIFTSLQLCYYLS